MNKLPLTQLAQEKQEKEQGQVTLLLIKIDKFQLPKGRRPQRCLVKITEAVWLMERITKKVNNCQPIRRMVDVKHVTVEKMYELFFLNYYYLPLTVYR